MKNLIIIIAIALTFASCQKESKFIEVQIIDIVASESESTVHYKVINHSDMDMNIRVDFDIDGTKQIGWMSDCKSYQANSTTMGTFVSTGEVYSVDYKVKICEI